MAFNVQSLLGSAAAGAGLGSAFTPIGAGIGAGGGAALDLLRQLFSGGLSGGDGQGILGNEFLSGKPGGIASANRFSQPQIDMMSQLGQMGLKGFNDPLQGFGPIKEDALNTFQTSIVPTILERFNASGDNALSSPSLHMQLGQGAQDFGRGLAAMQAQYGLQNRGQMLDLLGLSLNPQYDNIRTDAQSGLLQQLLPVIGSIGTQALGNKLGGMGWQESLAKVLSSAN